MKFRVDYYYKWSLVVLIVAMCSYTYAQRTVTGTVTDQETGDPLIGANILVIGTSSGTVTDIDGSYSLNVPEGSNVLEFSYTGYSSQRITLGASDVVNIALSAGELLEEVVVVGYGTVKKNDATGAVVAITEKDFNKGVINSPEQLLQGRTAGVQVTTASGEPGAGANIRIRGTSSVRSGNNPLFVVDGVPLDGGNVSSGGAGNFGGGGQSARNPLNFLNPDDIASISILKDASATAIYGSRGANGVVLITTKSGASGNTGLSYSGSMTLSSITQKYDLLSADEWRTAFAATGGNLAEADFGGDTDWQDVIFRNTLSNQHNVSYGSGTANSNYRISFSYLDQQGIMENSAMQRYTARINTSHKFLNERVTLSSQLTVGNVQDENPWVTDRAGFEGDILGAALNANPTRPIFDDKGEFLQPGNDQRNPAAILEYIRDRTATTRVLGSISADVKIAEGLSYRMNVGVDRAESTRRQAASSLLNIADIQNNDGRANLLNDFAYSELIEHTLNFNREFSNSNVNAVVGYSFQKFERRFNSIQAQRFRTTDVNIMLNNLESADFNNNADAYRAFSNFGIDNLQSFFGRVNYSLANKYLFTATLRADGSSRFGSENQYGYFPSAAFAWRLSQEDFIPDLFYDLKLRVGYGITGNQEFSSGEAFDRRRYQGDGSLTQVSFANENLQWEETSQINFGLDYAFSNGRISGSVDFYRRVTSDLLLRLTSAEPAPQPFTWTNLDADVINTGVEFMINTVIVDKSDFGFDVSFNATYNDNIVEGPIGLINTGEINGQGLTGAFAQRIANGQPLYSYYLRTFDGFDSEGFNIYADNEAITFIGRSPLPDVTAGLTLNFRFRNLDVSTFFNGVFGQYLYNNTANALFTKGALANGRNVTPEVANSNESILNSPDASTRFLEDGSFVRFQNLNIGYTFNTAGSSTFNSLRLFLTGQNIFTITGYSGQDPEVDVNKSLNNVPSLGIDYTPYPRARLFTLGVNVNFK